MALQSNDSLSTWRRAIVCICQCVSKCSRNGSFTHHCRVFRWAGAILLKSSHSFRQSGNCGKRQALPTAHHWQMIATASLQLPSSNCSQTSAICHAVCCSVCQQGLPPSFWDFAEAAAAVSRSALPLFHLIDFSLACSTVSLFPTHTHAFANPSPSLNFLRERQLTVVCLIMQMSQPFN